jgi:hypothetical protein
VGIFQLITFTDERCIVRVSHVPTTYLEQENQVYEANQVRFNIYTADSNEDGQLKNVFPVPTSLIVVKNEIYDQNPRGGE